MIGKQTLTVLNQSDVNNILRPGTAMACNRGLGNELIKWLKYIQFAIKIAIMKLITMMTIAKPIAIKLTDCWVSRLACTRTDSL